MAPAASALYLLRAYVFLLKAWKYALNKVAPLICNEEGARAWYTPAINCLVYGSERAHLQKYLFRRVAISINLVSAQTPLGSHQGSG